MFYADGSIYRSRLLDTGAVYHGFSTRRGGVSTHPETAEMNLAMGRADPEDTVRENIDIFARVLSRNRFGASSVVCAHQVHGLYVRYLTGKHRGEGVSLPVGEDCDAFVTDVPGVMPVVRVADCVPILLSGQKKSGAPVIGAAHAGWRGTAGGIAAHVVQAMLSRGALGDTIRVAIGAHIAPCCFEVGLDLLDEVTALCGHDFARRHVRIENGSLRADLAGMNIEMLYSSGVPRENIELSNDCTACKPYLYHSHRKTGGRRGAMGAGIVIV